MSVNDRLFDDLLRPVTDRFYETAKTLAAIRTLGDAPAWRRAFLTGQLETLQQVGTLIADTIEVAQPDWDAMREMALGWVTR